MRKGVKTGSGRVKEKVNKRRSVWYSEDTKNSVIASCALKFNRIWIQVKTTDEFCFCTFQKLYSRKGFICWSNVKNISPLEPIVVLQNIYEMNCSCSGISHLPTLTSCETSYYSTESAISDFVSPYLSTAAKLLSVFILDAIQIIQ
jgi:hypothetical protein